VKSQEVSKKDFLKKKKYRVNKTDNSHPTTTKKRKQDLLCVGVRVHME
jgi:hypothetical protein